MKSLFNQRRYKTIRSKLRNELTPAEKLLWYYIRNKQLGVKFRRQHGIGQYIVDFYCPQLKLVVEIDGHSHFSDESKNQDLARDDFLQSIGLTVIRLTNAQVLNELNSTLEHINLYIPMELKKHP